jgi:hypothetical protein
MINRNISLWFSCSTARNFVELSNISLSDMKKFIFSGNIQVIEDYNASLEEEQVIDSTDAIIDFESSNGSSDEDIIYACLNAMNGEYHLEYVDEDNGDGYFQIFKCKYSSTPILNKDKTFGELTRGV